LHIIFLINSHYIKLLSQIFIMKDTAACSWYNLVIILSWWTFLFLRLTLYYLACLNYIIRLVLFLFLNFYWLINFGWLEQLLIYTRTLSSTTLEPLITEKLFSCLAINFWDLLDHFYIFWVICSILVFRILNIFNGHLVFLFYRRVNI